VKHAGPAELDRLEPLLERLRAIAGLREKSCGTFYRGSRAFLHFHGHGDQLFADMRIHAEFERFPATTVAEQKALIVRVSGALKSTKT
jgi:hypothetical protein